MGYLLIHRCHTKLQLDSFTYGDHRQYVAFFADKSAILVRYSLLPVYMMMFGFTLLSLPAMAAYFAWEGIAVNWPYTLRIAAIGLVLLAPWAIMIVTPWRLVVTISKRMLPDKRGIYTRSF